MTVILSLALSATALIKLSQMRKRYRRLLAGAEGKDLEDVLWHHLKTVEQVQQGQEELKNKNEQVASQLKKLAEHSFTGVGLKRFNAFQDTGSNLSFSLAFLNRQNHGVVITSLFGREETRIYAKDIEKGESNYHLSEEEIKALSEAQKMIAEWEGDFADNQAVLGRKEP